MRYESAELAKITINCCLVASVTVANTLAEVCERIGADWSEIVPALKLDRRIGAYSYLAPGLGIAGGNLERDLATVVRLVGRHRHRCRRGPGLARQQPASQGLGGRTMRKVVLDKQSGRDGRGLGLAYKENTHSIKNSPSLATIAALPDAKLVLHDPVVNAVGGAARQVRCGGRAA